MTDEAAGKVLDAAGLAATTLLARYVAFDWGDVLTETERSANDMAAYVGRRIAAGYRVLDQVVWITTSPGRRNTIITLRDEYRSRIGEGRKCPTLWSPSK